jgi:hypothetical protein
MTRREFEKWVEQAAPGSRRTYHIGFLMDDRKASVSANVVNSIGHAAWEAMLMGKVHLTQRKLHKDGSAYEYIAERRPHGTKPVVFTGCYFKELEAA